MFLERGGKRREGRELPGGKYLPTRVLLPGKGFFCQKVRGWSMGWRQAQCGQVRREHCPPATHHGTPGTPSSGFWSPGGWGSSSVPPGRWKPHLRRGAVIYGDSPQSIPFTWPLVTGAGHEAEGLDGLQEGEGGSGADLAAPPARPEHIFSRPWFD